MEQQLPVGEHRDLVVGVVLVPSLGVAQVGRAGAAGGKQHGEPQDVAVLDRVIQSLVLALPPGVLLDVRGVAVTEVGSHALAGRAPDGAHVEDDLPVVAGQVIDIDDLAVLVDGLEARHLGAYFGSGVPVGEVDGVLVRVVGPAAGIDSALGVQGVGSLGDFVTI